MTWTIRYEREAERPIDALDPKIRRRVLLEIGNLARDPRSAHNVKALKDTTNTGFVLATGG